MRLDGLASLGPRCVPRGVKLIVRYGSMKRKTDTTQYILLGNWTDQGVRDNETHTHACLALVMQGNLRATTWRGFGEKEMETIVCTLG